jgi:hypothetical protein
LTELDSVDAAIHENPVNAIFQKHSHGWKVIFQVAEPVRELFYRQGGDDDFQSTGFGQGVDPRTGDPLPKVYVSLPTNTPAGHFEVRYTDQHGQVRGPFRVEFDPVSQELADYKRTLDLTKHSWLRFGAGQDRDKVFFTSLTPYKTAIQEVRFAVDRDTPDRTHVLPDPKSAGSVNQLFVTVPHDAKFATVQLRFVDDTTSEVVRIERTEP